MLLESMKKGVGKYVMIFLASLLILSFAVWGVGDMVGVISNPDEIATVGDTKITQREFQKQYRKQVNQIRTRLGNISAEQAKNIGIANVTLNGLIDKRLMDLQAIGLSLLVSDEVIRSKIREAPGFQNKLGEFDPIVFRTLLANNGLNEGTYVASLRQDIQRDYITGMISSASIAPPQLSDTVFQYQNERRIAEIVRVKRQMKKNLKTATDGQLKAYLDKHSTYFMAPEYRRFTVLYLDPKRVAKELFASEEQIRAEYEDQLGSLIVPETRDLEQMLFQNKTTAVKAFADISSAKSFSKYVASTPDKSAKITNIGFVSAKDLLPEIAEIVFSLNRGEISRPIKTPLGWHIMRVNDVKPGYTPPLKKVRLKITKELTYEMAIENLIKRADKIEDALAGGASIDDIGRELGVQIQKTEFVDSSRKLVSGIKLTRVPEDPRFIDIGFRLKQGATSDLLETQDGGHFLLRVDEIMPPAKQTLRQVRQLVQKAWKYDQLNKLAKNTAEQIQTNLKRNRNLTEAAKPFGLKAFTSKSTTRSGGGNTSNVPAAILQDLFQAKVGETFITQTKEGYAITRLISVKSGAKYKNRKEFENLEKMLSATLANDVIQQYANALRTEYPVSINKGGMAEYFSNQTKESTRP